MAEELTRWLATPPSQRGHAVHLARVYRNTDVAHAIVAGVQEVAQMAMLGAGSLALTKRQLELLAPEDAGKLDLIATAATVGMANVVARLASQ